MVRDCVVDVSTKSRDAIRKLYGNSSAKLACMANISATS